MKESRWWLVRFLKKEASAFRAIWRDETLSRFEKILKIAVIVVWFIVLVTTVLVWAAGMLVMLAALILWIGSLIKALVVKLLP